MFDVTAHCHQQCASAYFANSAGPISFKQTFSWGHEPFTHAKPPTVVGWTSPNVSLSLSLMVAVFVAVFNSFPPSFSYYLPCFSYRTFGCHKPILLVVTFWDLKLDPPRTQPCFQNLWSLKATFLWKINVSWRARLEISALSLNIHTYIHTFTATCTCINVHTHNQTRELLLTMLICLHVCSLYFLSTFSGYSQRHGCNDTRRRKTKLSCFCFLVLFQSSQPSNILVNIIL